MYVAAVGESYCRGCTRATAWQLIAVENAALSPPVKLWMCRSCQLVRTAYANVPDSEGLCRTTLSKSLAGGNRGLVKAVGEPISYDGLDYADALGWLQLQLWILYTRFDQSHGDGTGSFAGYATPLLAARLVDWYRKQHLMSRDGQPLEVKHVVSYDELTDSTRRDGSRRFDHDPGSGQLDSPVTEVTGNPLEDRSPDLARAIARGSQLADRDQGERDQDPDEAAP